MMAERDDTADNKLKTNKQVSVEANIRSHMQNWQSNHHTRQNNLLLDLANVRPAVRPPLSRKVSMTGTLAYYSKFVFFIFFLPCSEPRPFSNAISSPDKKNIIQFTAQQIRSFSQAVQKIIRYMVQTNNKQQHQGSQNNKYQATDRLLGTSSAPHGNKRMYKCLATSYISEHKFQTYKVAYVNQNCKMYSICAPNY